MAKGKAKVKHQKTLKPVEDKKDELSEKDLSKASGGAVSIFLKDK
jgi:hypothetical protein